MVLYRKMYTNVKSVQEYKLERARRKRILQLYLEGYTQKQIAEQLNVSAKTVCRDLQKLKKYISFLAWKEQKKVDDILHAQLQKIPLAMRYNFVTEMFTASISKDTKTAWRLLDQLLKAPGSYKPRRNGVEE